MRRNLLLRLAKNAANEPAAFLRSAA